MSGFLKIGERDRDGRQKRIEHAGRHLRVSRTGGLSLRAQTRVAGVNLSGNTSHGLRLSTRLARNTQVALQGGRFVLRGRYGTDALRLNLSKTGITASSRTPIGSFNWVRPQRSSAKLAGVQLRGRKAAGLQIAFGLIYLPLLLLTRLLQHIASAASMAIRLGTSLAAVRERRKVENARPVFPAHEVRPLAERRLATLGVELDDLPRRDLLALLTALIVIVGRGERRLPAVPRQQGFTAGTREALDADLASALERLSIWLPARDDGTDDGACATGLLIAVADRLARKVDDEFRVETLLSLDDAALAAGAKTLLQEAMIDRLAEALGVNVMLEGDV